MSKTVKVVKEELTSDEGAALLRLMAVVSENENYYAKLQKRAGFAGVRDKLDRTRTDMITVLQKIVETLPKEKKRLLQNTLSNVQVLIEVKPNTDNNGIPLMYEAKGNPEFVCVPADSMNVLLDYIMTNNCLICDGGEELQKECPYRKAIESLFLYKVKSDDGKTCKFSGLSAL